MVAYDDRRRRHDEQWQAAVLEGMNRMLQVLHDVSDGIVELNRTVRELTATVKSTPTPQPATSGADLLSIDELADLLGTTANGIRQLRYRRKAPPATKVGNRVRFRRADVDAWLAEQREPPVPTTRPWRTAALGGRIGHDVPRSTEQPGWCAGSHTEPYAASAYIGRAVCRACGDDVLVNQTGLLRKHRPRDW